MSEWGTPGDGDGWGAPATNGGGHGDTFDGIDPANVSKHDGGGGECFNCGQAGHNKADCPEPRKNSGECYNCGEQGHSKAECSNPSVERAFTGTCHLCGTEGHRASECPDKAPSKCRACGNEGHNAADCTDARKIYDDNVEALDADVAWVKLIDTDKEKDIEGFKKALLQYTRAMPNMTFVDVEAVLRESSCNVYIIAKEQEVSDIHTVVNLQGKKGCQYVVSFQYTGKPPRPKFAQGWPSSPEENLTRLENAGYVMDGLVPKCSNCDELGHIAKNCTQDKIEREKVEISCGNCKETGHRLRDCPNPRPERNVCRNCKQPGHKASDCEEPRSAEGVECKGCGETGHFAKDCPSKPKQLCRNCQEEGHRASECVNEKVLFCTNCETVGHEWRNCKKDKDWSKVKCTNCWQFGHTRVKCPQPPKEEGAGSMGGGGAADGGDSAGGDGDWGGTGGDATDAATDAGSTAGGGW